MDYQISPHYQPTSTSVQATTNAYTDLNSLNAIKNEENQDEALKKVAKQFESLFVHELLKNMRNANSAFEENNLFDKKESKFFRDMYDQQLSLSLTERGMGLSDVLYRQMKSSYGAAQEKSTAISPSMEFGADRVLGTKIKPQIIPNITPEDNVITESPKTTIFDSAETFVDAILPMAKKAASALGLDPLIMVAQSALETGWGKYVIKDASGESSHNLFNIKADSHWKGEKVSVSTVEYKDGFPVKEQAYFRKYDSIEASVNDFVSFITDNPRYQKAVSVARDGKQFLQKLQQSGYATDPEYAKKILSVFNALPNKLTQSDNLLGGSVNVK